MKKVKNYIDHELAKKKIARYKYWSIKDEGGITICTSEENNPDNKNFEEVLKQIMKDNVDAEIQIRYGTSDQSSRQNPPLFIKVNEKIEWVEPEEDNVNINGVPHKVDKNGNVNINFKTPTIPQPKVEKAVPVDTLRQEIDMRLEGIRKEYEIKEEKWKIDMQNKLMEQTLKFREMMLAEREVRLSEREQQITQQEQSLNQKQQEIKADVVGYIKQVPSALGTILKEFTKTEKGGLGKSKEETPPKPRKEAEFTIEEDEETEEIFTPEEMENEIASYEQEDDYFTDEEEDETAAFDQEMEEEQESTEEEDSVENDSDDLTNQEDNY